MGQPRSKQAAKRGSARRRPATGRDFWGTDDTNDQPIDPIAATNDPVAMVNSLGRPPLPGHEAAAERYFEAVYGRAVGLAVALAAANGLLAADADEHDPE